VPTEEISKANQKVKKERRQTVRLQGRTLKNTKLLFENGWSKFHPKKKGGQQVSISK